MLNRLTDFNVVDDIVRSFGALRLVESVNDLRPFFTSHQSDPDPLKG